MRWRSRRAASGFTLLELVITVAIVGILASALVPLGELTVRRAKEQELRAGLREIRTAIDAYKKAWDEGKIAKKTDDTGYPPSLQMLVDGVPELNKPNNSKIYFLRRLPRDPFADPQVRPEESWGRRSYASSATSPAAGKDVFDIYSRAVGTGLNGTAYREW